MERIKKKRSASKNVVRGLVVKIKDIIDDEGKRNEVLNMLKTIDTKMLAINALNDDILNEIDEDELEVDMEEATKFEISIMTDIDKIKEILRIEKESMNRIMKKEVSESPTSTLRGGVKLPKILIKKFSGDPISWQQFEETFDATITKNENISDI